MRHGWPCRSCFPQPPDPEFLHLLFLRAAGVLRSLKCRPSSPAVTVTIGAPRKSPDPQPKVIVEESPRLGGLMVTKCANRTCPNEFHYLRNGKLFLVEVEEESGRVSFGPQLVGERRKPRRVEHYWLCDDCTPTLTLAIDRQLGVVTVPAGTPVARRAAAG